jgi:hypothetical protein
MFLKKKRKRQMTKKRLSDRQALALVMEASESGLAKYLNQGPTQTIRSSNLDMHWVRLGLRDKWNASRISRFCLWDKRTPYEIASAIGMSHQRMISVMKGGHPTGTEALCLTLLAIGAMGHALASELLGGLPPTLLPIEDDQT